MNDIYSSVSMNKFRIAQRVVNSLLLDLSVLVFQTNLTSGHRQLDVSKTLQSTNPRKPKDLMTSGARPAPRSESEPSPARIVFSTRRPLRTACSCTSCRASSGRCRRSGVSPFARLAAHSRPPLESGIEASGNPYFFCHIWDFSREDQESIQKRKQFS